MYSDSLLITLTDNSWLYRGFSALLPDMVNVHLRFNDKDVPDIIRNSSKIYILVDCRIIFNGVWDSYNTLINLRPDSTVIWLTRMETGRIFPQGRKGDKSLAQNLDVVSLKKILKRITKNANDTKHVNKLKNISLTLTERKLLSFFASKLSIYAISRLTNKSPKTLYIHRQNILGKLGLRHTAFLQFVFQHSPWLLNSSIAQNTTERGANWKDSSDC